VARYLERCRLKTGVLFRAACELGALEGCPAELERLGSFGEQLGVAFQLLDDVLDVVGTQGQTGKPRGTDLLDGTVTLPLILARERDPELARLALRELGSAEQALKVCERIACSGAIDLVRERALGLVGAAKTSLSELPDLQRGVLELVADGVVERYA
jgi:geranylgeranyl pyrophosphate synthase